jgi:hypothetical protein
MLMCLLHAIDQNTNGRVLPSKNNFATRFVWSSKVGRVLVIIFLSKRSCPATP